MLKEFEPGLEDLADALVTDPPAGIGFMGKEWDKDKGGRDQWIMWLAGILSECYRLLKPGAHALVWALPKTSHWTAIALEEAGFEIRDVGVHLFGTGFPKSLDVSKAIDKAAGVERKVVGPSMYAARANTHGRAMSPGDEARSAIDRRLVTAPATEAARRWEGWGTALKPAAEHWILARKPLGEDTVAANVLEWGTGALNIDACRIGGDIVGWGGGGRGANDDSTWNGDTCGFKAGGARPVAGRWPANVTLDEEAAELLDAELVLRGARCSKGDSSGANTGRLGSTGIYHNAQGLDGSQIGYGDGKPGASRFFYTAKASRVDREYGCENLPRKGSAANHHPTVKPRSLMRWLARLITPPGGLILDPFAGTGSTGIAALFEGFRFIGIEASPEYTPIARARLTKALKDTGDATAA